MKKNIPILQHGCDDLEIEYAGGAYKPHEGENVWFLPYLSTPDMLALTELSEADSENTLAVLIDDVCPVLVKIIDSWNWTHALTGEPLGTLVGNGRYRPSVDDISPLHPREIVYLVNAFFEETQPKAEANPQSAS